MSISSRPINPIEVFVTLRRQDLPAVGHERIRLLETVSRAGSIAAAAKALGVTYKTAWDAIDAMTNLFGAPLIETRVGGKAGGGARLTPTGAKVIEAYGKLEAELARALRSIEPELAGSGVSPIDLMSGFFMRTSARNALRGIITHIDEGALSAEVAVTVSPEGVIHALVTRESIRELGLCVGREAIVLIKAPFVMISPGDTPPAISARNCIRGMVRRCEIAGLGAEVVLDIGGGKTLVASITADSVTALGLAADKPAFAFFDASHVIIAID